MKTFAKSLFVSASLVALLAVPSSAAESQMREGQWEITTKIDVPGMPVSIPPITIKKCLTKEDVSDPNKSLPKTSKSDACKVSDYKVSGSKVTWSIKCDDKNGAVNGTGEMTFKGDSYDGEMKMNTQGQDMTVQFSGKRTGDCK